MNDFIDLTKWRSTAESLLDMIITRIQDPLFWLQFAIIAAVFVLARWLVTPLLKKALARLAASCTRVPIFRSPLAALAVIDEKTRLWFDSACQP